MANQQAPASQALTAPAQPQDRYSALAGTFSKANGLTARLRWAEDNGHLVSPATTCGRLPEGCSVALSIVHLDANVDAHNVGFGKLGLLKHAVMKIAAAAGVSFDPHASGRVDDGSDPYYVHWKAIGAWRHLDGSVLPLVGDKEMDLRDDSAQVERIFANASTQPKAVTQLMEMRAFIMAHAQSKAELRAIRKGLGLRSYTAVELEKPFVVAKLMFTGQSDNPRIAEANAAAIRNSMLGGAQALFGPPAGSTVPTPQLPMAHNVSVGFGHAPPPVGSTRPDFPDEDSAPALGGHIDTTGTSVPEAKPKASKATPRASAAAAPATNGVHLVRFGKQKDKPITEISDENLDWYMGAIKKSIDDPEKARFRADNEADYQATLAEMERRNGVPPAAANGATPAATAPAATAPAATKPATEKTPPPDFSEADRGDAPEDY